LNKLQIAGLPLTLKKPESVRLRKEVKYAMYHVSWICTSASALPHGTMCKVVRKGVIEGRVLKV